MTQNRLQQEARRTAQIRTVAAIAALVTAAATTYGINAELQEYKSAGWKVVFGTLVISVMNWWQSIRMRRRATWYETTSEWWLHLDDAPEIRPLPSRFYDTIDRVEKRPRAVSNQP